MSENSCKETHTLAHLAALQPLEASAAWQGAVVWPHVVQQFCAQDKETLWQPCTPPKANDLIDGNASEYEGWSGAYVVGQELLKRFPIAGKGRVVVSGVDAPAAIGDERLLAGFCGLLLGRALDRSGLSHFEQCRTDKVGCKPVSHKSGRH